MRTVPGVRAKNIILIKYSRNCRTSTGKRKIFVLFSEKEPQMTLRLVPVNPSWSHVSGKYDGKFEKTAKIILKKAGKDVNYFSVKAIQ